MKVSGNPCIHTPGGYRGTGWKGQALPSPRRPVMHTEPGYITEKQAIQTRLRCIEGQVRGLQRLVDEDT